MDTVTAYTPGSENFGGLHCSVLLSTKPPLQERGGLDSGTAGRRLLVGALFA